MIFHVGCFLAAFAGPLAIFAVGIVGNAKILELELAEFAENGL